MPEGDPPKPHAGVSIRALATQNAQQPHPQLLGLTPVGVTEVVSQQ